MPGNAPHDAHTMRSLRYLPLVLFSILGGSFIYVLNPGLFWDDWVWIHQDKAENIQISKELGIWWAGHLSNYFYSFKNPVLVLRLISLVAWAVAAAASVYVLRVRAVIDRTEGMLIFALIAATHVAGVRFLNSVAMYNVYIAAFWLGCAFLVARPDKLWARLLAAALFFFSFHLNSMLVIYALVLALLFAEDIRRAFRAEHATDIVPGGLNRPLSYWFDRQPYRVFGATTMKVVPAGVKQFIRDNVLFIVLPVLFYASIKFVSLAMSTVLSSQQRIYSDYNSIKIANLLKAAVEIPWTFLRTLYQYLLLIIVAVPPSMMLAYCGITLACFILLRRHGRMPSWTNIRYQLLMGVLLFAASMYPYLLVGKPPVLFDFYEARNVMPALPGMALFFMGLANIGTLIVARFVPFIALPARNLAFSILIGLALSCQFVMGTDLMKDWMRQEAIATYASERKQELDRFSTIFVVDNANGFRTNGRQIWNYEYTGLFVNVFGRQTKLGIAPAEYNGWPQRVFLVHDPVYRKRYNISEYDPKLPQVVIEVSNSAVYPEIRDLFTYMRLFWTGGSTTELTRRFFHFSAYEQFTEAPKRLAELAQIIKLMEQHRTATGLYPNTTLLTPDVSTGKTAIGVRPLSQATVPAYFNAIPKLKSGNGLICENEKTDSFGLPAPLAPMATKNESESCKIKVECITPSCGYLYMSDGVDYKLVYRFPADMPYAKQAFPENIDPMREAYGHWTPGALRW